MLDNVDSLEEVEVLFITFKPDLATVRLMGKYFESKGHTCKGVVYGERGLYLLRNFLKPKVVLINIYLEDMMGRELCKIIKSDPDLKNIPVIYLTTRTEDFHEEMADGYIHLPFRFSDFDIILDLVNRRSLTDEEIENSESDKAKSLIKQYEKETEKHAIWRGSITEGFKKWLKGEKIFTRKR